MWCTEKILICLFIRPKHIHYWLRICYRRQAFSETKDKSLSRKSSTNFKHIWNKIHHLFKKCIRYHVEVVEVMTNVSATMQKSAVHVNLVTEWGLVVSPKPWRESRSWNAVGWSCERYTYISLMLGKGVPPNMPSPMIWMDILSEV